MLALLVAIGAAPDGAGTAGQTASPVATPGGAAATDAPYGIGAITLEPGVAPDEMEGLRAFLPAEVAGLPQRRTASDAGGATVVYLVDEDPNAPRFGLVVAVKVKPAADADALVARLERDRWGDPADHVATGAGDGTRGEPAYREFSRVFAATQFALPNRPVFFLLWYRAGDEYAFMVIAESAAVRENLSRAVAQALRAGNQLG